MSTTPHKARTEVWAAVERFSRNEMDIMNCVLELRARVEALEREAAMNELRAVSAEVRPAPFDEAENDRRFEQAKAIINQPAPAPATSLVERVAEAMGPQTWAAEQAGELPYGTARAAIREVATYIRQHNPFFELDTPAESDVWGAVAELLDQEVNRD